MRTLALLLALPLSAFAQGPIASATANLRQVQQAFGRGVQLYRCQAGSLKFVPLGPDAVLYKDAASHEQVATHGIGPVWQWGDGSGVFGTVRQTVPASDPALNVATLVLAAQPFGIPNGVLAPVTVVTRTDAKGGAAPSAGCDAGHVGTVARVPYTATYTFYAAR